MRPVLNGIFLREFGMSVVKFKGSDCSVGVMVSAPSEDTLPVSELRVLLVFP